MLTTIKINNRRVLTPLQLETIPRTRPHEEVLMDALRALAQMAEAKPSLVDDLAWARASEGIATILKRGNL